MVRHGGQSCLERLPGFETMLPCDQFLRIAQTKTVREDVRIGHLAEAGQARPDLGGDRIVTVTMPAQDELGLFAEVLKIRHGRSYG